MDGVAEVDIDVEAQAGGGQLPGKGDPYTVVRVFVADDFGDRGGGVEHQSVGDREAGHGADQTQNVIDVARQVVAVQVDRCSQQDLQGRSHAWFGVREVTFHLQQRRGLGSWAAQPAPQCADGQFAALLVA